MSELKEQGIEKEVALESVITSAIQIPGVKVERKKFLAEMSATGNVTEKDINEAREICSRLGLENK